jgi:hypothetical protein
MSEFVNTGQSGRNDTASFATIPAVVVHGNTLSVEEWSHWRTPAHILGFWDSNLKRRENEQRKSLALSTVEPAPAKPPIALITAVHARHCNIQGNDVRLYITGALQTGEAALRQRGWMRIFQAARAICWPRRQLPFDSPRACESNTAMMSRMPYDNCRV